VLGPAGGADGPTVRDLLVVDAAVVVGGVMVVRAVPAVPGTVARARTAAPFRARESGRRPPDRRPLHPPRHRGSARHRSV